MTKIQCAIIGSGNIGTDLMIKIMRNAQYLEMGAMVGVDPNSDGLARAAKFGFATTAESVEGLVKLPNFKDIKIVFDATSAGAHAHHNTMLQQYGIQVIDLTPAAIGPYVVPVVNLDEHLDASNINMVTVAGKQPFQWYMQCHVLHRFTMRKSLLRLPVNRQGRVRVPILMNLPKLHLKLLKTWVVLKKAKPSLL